MTRKRRKKTVGGLDDTSMEDVPTMPDLDLAGMEVDLSGLEVDFSGLEVDFSGLEVDFDALTDCPDLAELFPEPD